MQNLLPSLPVSPKLPASCCAVSKTAWLGVIAALALGAVAAPSAPGFKSLFNGKDLSGWEGDPAYWSVKDGVITGQTTADRQPAANTFLIWKGGAVKDFELRLSFKIVGNNPANWGNS